ncbi:alpha/beta hydrolase [Streptomyces sp. BYX5S]
MSGTQEPRAHPDAAAETPATDEADPARSATEDGGREEAGHEDGGREDAGREDNGREDGGREDSGREGTSGKQPPRPRRMLYVTLPGSWTAVVFGCLSFTPSLLPRGGLLQGVICGITAAIGYGLGVLAAWVWREFADREARPARRRSWRTFFVTAPALFAVAFGLGQYWQHEIRRLMGVRDYNLLLTIVSPLVAVLVFCLVLVTGRGVRGLYRWLAGLLRRRIGARAAGATGWILVAALAYATVTGLLLDGFISLANQTFSARDTVTQEGAHRPTVGARSGGPGSLVPWDSLGREGRSFTGRGPTTADIARFTHGSAQQPIRAYAGLDSAESTEARAELAVADLKRAGGFERKNLLVATTTGSGWIDPAAVDTFEYLSGGDSAAVALQYSYLPSWISYLVDQSKAREAGRDLFDAVYDTWSRLPQDQRPRLYVAGESLGSFGGEAPFSGEADLRIRTAGTLFAGPPNFNTLYRQFTDERASGSREIQPVYKDGRTVRFTNDPASDIAPADRPWDGTRVLYLMHPSDPIVWWSPRLVLHEPDWLDEPHGKDVLGRTRWLPFVTFWQVTADLPFATGVPSGHGHTYVTEYVDGWNTVMRPSGFSGQDLARLKDIIAAGH